MPNPSHLGSDLDAMLEADDLLADVESTALKRVVAFQIRQSMDTQKLSKTAMAKRMRTSRASLDRLLDPENPSVTLHTLERAALALGKRLRIHLD